MKIAPYLKPEHRNHLASMLRELRRGPELCYVPRRNHAFKALGFARESDCTVSQLISRAVYGYAEELAERFPNTSAVLTPFVEVTEVADSSDLSAVSPGWVSEVDSILPLVARGESLGLNFEKLELEVGEVREAYEDFTYQVIRVGVQARVSDVQFLADIQSIVDERRKAELTAQDEAVAFKTYLALRKRFEGR